jgi:predicted dehydrogenase
MIAAGVPAGAIGHVISFDNAFCSYVDMTHRWNATPTISGGGVIVDNGTHSVDITRYLIGPVTEVLAARAAPGQKVEVEDTACILVKTTSAAVGIIQLSWSVNRHLDHFVSIYGTSGTLHVGWNGLRYRLIDKLQWEEFGDGYHKIQAIRAQTLNFIRSVRGLEQPLIAPEDALASVKVIEAAYRSLASNRWEGVV